MQMIELHRGGKLRKLQSGLGMKAGPAANGLAFSRSSGSGTCSLLAGSPASAGSRLSDLRGRKESKEDKVGSVREKSGTGTTQKQVQHWQMTLGVLAGARKSETLLKKCT